MQSFCPTPPHKRLNLSSLSLVWVQAAKDKAERERVAQEQAAEQAAEQARPARISAALYPSLTPHQPRISR